MAKVFRFQGRPYSAVDQRIISAEDLPYQEESGWIVYLLDTFPLWLRASPSIATPTATGLDYFDQPSRTDFHRLPRRTHSEIPIIFSIVPSSTRRCGVATVVVPRPAALAVRYARDTPDSSNTTPCWVLDATCRSCRLHRASIASSSLSLPGGSRSSLDSQHELLRTWEDQRISGFPGASVLLFT